LLQLNDPGVTGGDGPVQRDPTGSVQAEAGGVSVSTPPKINTRLLGVRRLLSDIQQHADQTDWRLGKLAKKYERHDAEITDLKSKVVSICRL
jgi:hypothetical protein